MLNLIQNENMKIYRRLRTWILAGILVTLVVGTSLITRSTANRHNEGWEAEARSSIALSEQRLADRADMPDLAKEEMRRTIAVNQYRLDNGIPPSNQTLWGVVLSMSEWIQIVTIFTVVVAADIVAGEFTAGTIKLLLIRPASRSKILMSKYLATIGFSILLLVTLFGTTFILNGFLYGFTDVGSPYLHVDASMKVQESSMLLHALNTYALKCVELIMVVTLAFMISTVFRSSSLSIGLSLLMLFLGQAITLFFSQWSWGRFWLFSNTDLTQYLEGKPMFDGMTMSASIAILLVYFIVFNLLSWSIFNRRDVAA
ncbi:ABC transporter permease subunit [Gorillibacterium sp. sgz5001074]|uniref:ABC transporter permease n=1 Tax=Gorillibacterium sp. sgz5001074 TaxID=3446695 RepID=UPI003F6682A1